ncbi:MAG: RluA family pseudouridine synthase [Clostridium sp.]
MEEVREFLIKEEEVGTRIDVYLSKEMDTTRSQVQKLIDEEYIKVNESKTKSNYKLRIGDVITSVDKEPVVLEVTPENIDIDIIYEDNDIVVVNKKRGMVVHPAPGNYSGTLVNALLYHCKNLSSINGVIRPGIVHRIDKDTTGVLVVAKSDVAHQSLSKQIKEHTVTRSYVALVEGVVKTESGIVDKPIGRHQVDRRKMCITEKNSRNAITHYKVIEKLPRYTLIEAKLETGRTHQIRVHMASLGYPIVGDPVYGFKKQRFSIEGQALHAKMLGFIHPTTGEYVEFSAEIPEDFNKVLKNIKNTCQ